MVALYIRVSTSDQSTELQQKELEAYARLKGWTEFEVYDDSGVSGTHGNRTQLKRMLKDARDGKIKTVITWKLDRLFRSLKDLIITLQEFSELNIEFISLKDNIDLTTAAGRLMMHMIGAFAEFEACLIRERVNAGMEHAKKVGTKSGKEIGRPMINDYAAIVGLRQQGLSYISIQNQLGVTKGAVCRALKK